MGSISLIKAPALEQAPFEAAGLRLEAVEPGPVTALMPYRGRHAAVATALEKSHGLGWPEPGQVIASGGQRIAWSAYNTALVIGAELPPRLANHTAMTPQGDGMACLRLSGAAWRDALARLTPLTFEQDAERGMLMHVPALFLRGDDAVEVFVMRSMARTAWHELQSAMERLAGRAAIS
ncbi:hypothetical protein IV417_15550 [Alphaproteobacteria bacterium KMM 3653]|uniref:Sarcosine oxidase subunit gamma n=1 Tax=Harenicola maris TaxID=2841044 RepID=A0AAP2CQR7_9RHOB|nr:hypothetical protein [Harenicola maris]